MKRTKMTCPTSTSHRLVSSLVSVLISTAAMAIAKVAPPDIVVIMADDMGYSDLGCMGSEIRTPHLDSLAGNGLLFTRFDNTVILFLSDNGSSDEVINGTNTRHGNFPQGGTRPAVMPGGPETYASVGKGWANASNTPFRRYKKWTHEGGIATPLIVHWPSGIFANGEIRRQVGHVIDIMATAVDLAGTTYPSRRGGHDIIPLEGISLRPAFADGDRPLSREALYWEHMGPRAIRTGDWKLVGTRNSWKLFDLENDPIETRDLAADHPDRVATMADMWEAWAERSLVK